MSWSRLGRRVERQSIRSMNLWLFCNTKEVMVFFVKFGEVCAVK